MVLAKEVYKAFEDIVGPRNISEDIGICETYRAIPAQSSDHRGPYSTKTPLPLAVILPGSTEEVQKIIKLCNKYNIQFKASTTFWSVMGYIGGDNSVQLDMRRMRRIEIDAKNMYAIVEPYAIGAVVQAEALKVGLNLKFTRGRLLKLCCSEYSRVGRLWSPNNIYGCSDRKHAGCRMGAA